MTDLDNLIFDDSLFVVLEENLKNIVHEILVLDIAKESYKENKKLMDALKENGD